MAAKIFEFKPTLVSPMHSLYVLVQEACNWAAALHLRAFDLGSRESIDAATCVTLSAEQQVARAQQIVSVKYDAQLAEQQARNIGETLLYRGSDFKEERNYKLRQLHILDGEITAIEVQVLCASLIADAAEREGLDRPVGETQFLMAKLGRKQSDAAVLQGKIDILVAAEAAAEVYPSETSVATASSAE
jgi:hypothetical protein